MKDFIEKLIVTNLPSDQQRQKETWDVEGILHNQKYKFDLRPIKNNYKIGFFKSKADNASQPFLATYGTYSQPCQQSSRAKISLLFCFMRAFRT